MNKKFVLGRCLWGCFRTFIAGGFGIGLGVGGAIATPIGDYTFGQGQSKRPIFASSLLKYLFIFCVFCCPTGVALGK